MRSCYDTRFSEPCFNEYTRGGNLHGLLCKWVKLCWDKVPMEMAYIDDGRY